MDRSYFTSRPPQFWQSDENVKKFFAWASEFIDLFRYNLGIKNASEWSSVNPIRIESLSGKGLTKTRGSIPSALAVAYPDVFKAPPPAVEPDAPTKPDKAPKPKPEKLNKDKPTVEPKTKSSDPAATPAPKATKASPKVKPAPVAKSPKQSPLEIQKQVVDAIGKKLGIGADDYDKWYAVPLREFLQNGAADFLSAKYSNSPFLLLCAVYPEYEWLPWEFEVPLPRALWKDPRVLKKAVKFAESELRISEPEDWGRVKIADLRELGLDDVFKNQQSIATVLRHVYKDEGW